MMKNVNGTKLIKGTKLMMKNVNGTKLMMKNVNVMKLMMRERKWKTKNK